MGRERIQGCYHEVHLLEGVKDIQKINPLPVNADESTIDREGYFIRYWESQEWSSEI